MSWVSGFFARRRVLLGALRCFTASIARHTASLVHPLSENAEGIVHVLRKLADQVEKGVGFALQTAPNAPEPVGFSPKTAVDASTLAQCRLALWLRVHIIAGQFRAEGASSAAASLLSATGAQSFSAVHNLFPMAARFPLSVHYFACFVARSRGGSPTYGYTSRVGAVLGGLQHFGRAFVDFSPTMRPKLP